MSWLASEKKEISLGVEPRTPNGKALIDVPANPSAMRDVVTDGHTEYDNYIPENVRSFSWTCTLAVHAY